MSVSTIPRTSDSIIVSWGTTIGVTVKRTHSLVCVGDNVLVLVWIPSTSDVNILAISPKGVVRKSGTGTLTTTDAETQMGFTITRNGSSFTLTTSANTSFTAFY